MKEVSHTATLRLPLRLLKGGCGGCSETCIKIAKALREFDGKN